MLSCSVHQHDKHALLTEHREQVPFAGSSIHGPFMMFKMLQAPLYSRSGSSLGVRRKHLRCKRDRLLPDVSKSADQHAVRGVVCTVTNCGVLIWLAALTSCWNIFLSFMGSIPALFGRNELGHLNACKVKVIQLRGNNSSCLALIYLINHTKGAVGKILK